MRVVVVESPAKAKTINKYLGDDYRVLASYGHVRDLPAKDGSVRPDEAFSMDWTVEGKADSHIREITKALKGADTLILATDPDREGEAISWHVREVLREKKALNKIAVQRVTFNEITRDAVRAAMANPRELDQDLVDAYMARRALDYLVGFTLSPVLWRKLPGSRSAGRVQSVALRLICEREAEIERFRAEEYWTIEADFTAVAETVTARLTHLDGRKLDKLDLKSRADADRAVTAIRAAPHTVLDVERKQTRRNPAPPFTTSTLQQEAARKLGFTSSRTMQIAQRLYEGVDIGGETVGLITYMRTDGVSMAGEAIASIRSLIGRVHGERYVPESPRVYKTKQKNAQEAHEAIRPTDAHRTPDKVARHLDRDQLRLYELIWKRAVASQMASAVLDQVAVDIGHADRKVILRATGSVVLFDGFLALYREDRDDEEEEGEKRLPNLQPGQAAGLGEVRPEQHFTQPPPRYTEASLVKRMEELGIGRPSTYASIISVLQDRDYVRLDAKRFIPEDRGRLVTTFLENFFERYVQYGFTADLENQLDEISGGRLEWRQVLAEFWRDFKAAVDGTSDLRVSEVLERLDKVLEPHLFPPVTGPDGTPGDPRLCPTCKVGRLSLKLGKFGAFVGCSNYPDCRFTRPLGTAGDSDKPSGDAAAEGPKLLGTHPVSNLPVTLRRGPYGHYVQEGDEAPPAPKSETPKGKGKAKAKAEKAPKPKRASLPKGMDPNAVDLATAVGLLALPREVGRHPESGEMILAGIGRFGPYLKHGDAYKSLGRDDDVLSIGLNRAVVVLAEAKSGRASAPPRLLGKHEGRAVSVRSGRFGPYVSREGSDVRANLPKGRDPDSLTLEEAVALLTAKAARGKGKAPARGEAKAKETDGSGTARKPAGRKTGS